MVRLFVVSHTHWDREWYQPFQVFRLRLVDCIDRLLDLFAADPDFPFLLDGQTIVLDDYLEVRPDARSHIEQLVQSGRLQIGPWYVLPDTFLVSGEAIIRNLLRGRRTANAFGGSMSVGYVPDPFGHISQLPQILRGFGMDSAVLRRGLADEPLELWWEGADGCRVLLCYLRQGYDNAAFLPHDEPGFVQGLKGQSDLLAPFSATGCLLLMHGTDHMEPWSDLPRLLSAARAQMPDTEIIHASLPSFVSQIQAAVAHNRLDLPIIRGELRNPKRHPLLPGVASARIWIKQRNAHSQMLLEKWAEPLTAIAALLVPKQTPPGGSAATPNPTSVQSNKDKTDLAWRYLLQNHPHDSICGCGVDAAHEDMRLRFDWVDQIGEEVTAAVISRLAAEIDTRGNAGQIPIIVFNPLVGARTELVTMSLSLDGGPEGYELHDREGNLIPCHIHEEHAESQRRDEGGQSLQATHEGSTRAPNEMEFIAEMPGCGYKTYFLTRAAEPPVVPAPASTPAIENEFFRVEQDPSDGTLTITDKTTGAVYRGANRLVDGGDRGDLYNYCPPENDLVVDAPAAPPQILIQQTPVRQSLRLTVDYALPACLDVGRAFRSDQQVTVPVDILVSVYPGVQRIDFRVSLDNRARDHRLQAEFPTPIITDHVSAEQPFDIVDRPLELPHDSLGWVEQPRPEGPMQTCATLSDGILGLTLASRGLREYQAQRDPAGSTLRLTLLRSVGWLSRGDLSTRQGEAGPQMETPGALEIGTHQFEYSLIPHPGDWSHSLHHAHAFATPLRALATTGHPGSLPPEKSFVIASPEEFVVTAVKLPETGAGLIVRGYNSSDQMIEVQLQVWRAFRTATRVNLAEEPITPLSLEESNATRFGVRPKEIATILFSDLPSPSES